MVALIGHTFGRIFGRRRHIHRLEVCLGRRQGLGKRCRIALVGRVQLAATTAPVSRSTAGDIIDKNLMELAHKKIRGMLVFSDAGLEEICEFHRQVVENMRLAFSVFHGR